MIYKNILIENKERVCYITINRPKQLNALNSVTILELGKAIKIAEDDNTIRCIILTGFGKKAFVAGADIKELSLLNKTEGEALARKSQELVFDPLENAKTPSIAAINGFALGGGLELAMSCHFRIASENAKMGLPEVSLGIIPGYGGTQRLANLVGKGRALEMITTAGMLTANEAKEWGLINHVSSQENLLPTVDIIANKIKKNSPLAIAKAIKSVNAGFIDTMNGFEVEKKEFGDCFETDEFIEGITAFMEKRKPNF